AAATAVAAGAVVAVPMTRRWLKWPTPNMPVGAACAATGAAAGRRPIAPAVALRMHSAPTPATRSALTRTVKARVNCLRRTGPTVPPTSAHLGVTSPGSPDVGAFLPALPCCDAQPSRLKRRRRTFSIQNELSKDGKGHFCRRTRSPRGSPRSAYTAHEGDSVASHTLKRAATVLCLSTLALTGTLVGPSLTHALADTVDTPASDQAAPNPAPAEAQSTTAPDPSPPADGQTDATQPPAAQQPDPVPFDSTQYLPDGSSGKT